MSVTLLVTNLLTVVSALRKAEKDVVVVLVVVKEEVAEAIVEEKVVEAEEITVEKVVGSLEVVRVVITLTAHVYVIVVAKLGTRPIVAHMLRSSRSCRKSVKMVQTLS
jgi:hypothetical protein